MHSFYIYIFFGTSREEKKNEKPTERAVMKWQRCSNKFVYLDHVACGFFQRIFKPCTIIVLKEAKMEQKQKMQNTRPKFVSHEENIIKKNIKPFKIIKSIELRRNYKLQKNPSFMQNVCTGNYLWNKHLDLKNLSCFMFSSGLNEIGD